MIDNPETDPHKNVHLIFDTWAKAFNGGRVAFSVNGTGAMSVH